MSIRLKIGWPGYGKSLAMQDECADFVIHDRRLVFAIDRAGEWHIDAKDAQGRRRWRGEPPPISELPQALKDDPDALYSELVKLRDSGRGMLVRFAFPFDGFKVGALARDVGDVIVADDEADYTTSRGSWELMHTPNSKGKCACGHEDGEACPLRDFSFNPYRDFCHRGRHLPSPIDYVPREVHRLGAMRRPENVHTDLTSLAEEVMLFRIGGHNTLSRIVDEGWLTQEQLPELGSLPPLHYFLHKKGEGTQRGNVQGL